MFLIREFETVMEADARAGKLPGTFHSSVGQEAVAVGVCAALRQNDLIVSTHRGHGHYLAKGGDPLKLAAELYGLDAGLSAGKGGSQHFADPSIGFMGSNGITGGGIPIALGLALALERLSDTRLAVAIFGDGASNQGVFHESLNLAVLWKLPILFVCENNGWGMSTPTAKTVAGGSVARRGDAYGMLHKTVDGNDVDAVLDNMRAAILMVHQSGEPVLLECRTWRKRGHSRSDDNRYRDRTEENIWEARDPLTLARARLLQTKRAMEEELHAWEEKIRRRVADIRTHCTALPPAVPEKALVNVLAPIPPFSSPKTDSTASVTEAKTSQVNALPAIEKYYWEALNETLAEALAADERVFLLGEDIGEYDGCFKVTRGLLKRFGKRRVTDTPISEATLVGMAAGAAAAGLRPVLEIMFMDFLLLGLDQLTNQAAKFRYVYDGKITVPLVIRTPMGGYRGYGATHSQCLEALLMKIPGIRVFAPWSPADARALLRTALAANDPTVIVEHKSLYGTRGPVPKTMEWETEPKAQIVRSGRDVTICAHSYMVTAALAAAEQLAAEGVEAEVVNLRRIAPPDSQTVAQSAMRTQRLVVVEEGCRTGGVGAEIAAAVQEAAFGCLDAPIVRVAAADTPVPAAPPQERAVLPNAGKIVAAVRGLLGKS
jgi:pyruvate/2-oxoglutarate/acetoin dehydrogenase E1 component/TPP-dependent pyruvate/acetoin dehydrogenase alpha subunit